MKQTDFSKVESLLDAGLLKMTVGHLLKLADLAQLGDEENTPFSGKESLKDVIALNLEFKRLLKIDPLIAEKLGIKKRTLRRILEEPASLTNEEWTFLKEIRNKLLQYKEDLFKQFPQPTDEEIIENQIKEHRNKQFNVRKKWLPLK